MCLKRNLYFCLKPTVMSLIEIFNTEDFSKMIFNPFKVKSLKKKYPKLKMYKTIKNSEKQIKKKVLCWDVFYFFI